MTSLRAYPHFAIIRGTRRAIDDEEVGMVWAEMPPPTCECGASLGRYNDEDDRRISVVGDWTRRPLVHCDSCGREAPIEDEVTPPCVST